MENTQKPNNSGPSIDVDNPSVPPQARIVDKFVVIDFDRDGNPDQVIDLDNHQEGNKENSSANVKVAIIMAIGPIIAATITAIIEYLKNQ